MNAAMLTGAALAGGLLLVLTGWYPARVPLAVALDRIHRPAPQPNPTPTTGTTMWTRLVGTPIAASPIGTHVKSRFAADLRVAGVSLDEIIAKMTLAALAGLIWAPAIVAVMATGGIRMSWIVPVWLAVAFAAAGGIVPLSTVRSEAARRRVGFRHALSCFLDLVAVRLAGGAGVDSALNQSADSGQGWAFTEIRQALAEARLMGEPPWVALGRLGQQLDIAELGELAASTALAGGEGARVRVSLAGKARSIRTKGLADAEAAAQAASERMSLPIVLLMVGFVAFLGYPAVMQVFTGL